MKKAVGDNYTIHIDDRPYPLFEASEFLLLVIASAKGEKRRHNIIDFPEEYQTKCRTCLFAEHCNVNVEGAMC